MRSATISRKVELSGYGLFSALPCQATLIPAEFGAGLRLLIDGEQVPMTVDNSVEQPSCTSIGTASSNVGVVEHLLAALWAAGIDTLTVSVNGPELPNFDGSAFPFYELIREADVVPLGERPRLELTDPLQVSEGDAYIKVAPADSLSIEYHFSHPELGEHRYCAELQRESALTELLPARSFITQTEAHEAIEAGILQNDDPNSALLLHNDGDGSWQPHIPLRFPDELPRHKVLDFVGDLYLAPFEWTGHVTAHRSGHRLNRMLARELVALAQRPLLRLGSL